MSTDSWLEAPYQNAAIEEAAHEHFQETADFEEAFRFFFEDLGYEEVENDEALARLDFIQHPHYADAFEGWYRR